MTINIEALRKAAEAATPGPWSNIDDKRGRKKSIWVENSAKEMEDVYGGPSRYGPSREYIANFVQSRCGKQDAHDNADFVAAANPAAILELITRLRAAEDEVRVLRKLMESES